MASKTKVVQKGGDFTGAYIVAMVGAAVYFIQQTHGFWGVIFALIKALVWPGFLIYKAFVLMHI